MSGIAGIVAPGGGEVVERMLGLISHRGPAGRRVVEAHGATLGLAWSAAQPDAAALLEREGVLRDQAGSERHAQACARDGRWLLERDPLGVAPLYFGTDDDGVLGFASEVKALAAFTRRVREVPPGCRLDGTRVERCREENESPPLADSEAVVALELERRLAAAVAARCSGGTMGSWLSGGLDSSALAALARPHLRTLYTFAAGVGGAPDLEFAREMAAHIGSRHHEVVVDAGRMLRILPDVIYHLESFDALLVRSSITNFLVARLASDYVAEVFSGEGGDELFAGYEYLKSIPEEALPAELHDILGRLHNTALQRVDRCAAAHGIVAHVPFLDPDVVAFARRIPAGFKLRVGVEKWILRRAMVGKLPSRVLDRTKAKFWEGAGVCELMARQAGDRVSDADFARERILPNGWVLDSKEELMYYRLFRDRFGELQDLSWMGRTKKLPASPDLSRR